MVGLDVVRVYGACCCAWSFPLRVVWCKRNLGGRGTGLWYEGRDRAGRAGRPAAGAVDRPCVLVGGQPSPSRVRLGWRDRRAARYHKVEGRRTAEKVLASLPTRPVPEIRRHGKTLRQWRQAFPACFDTGRASNDGTEATNGLIELHHRIAPGFHDQDHYQLHTPLISSGPSHPHPRQEEPIWSPGRASSFGQLTPVLLPRLIAAGARLPPRERPQLDPK